VHYAHRAGDRAMALRAYEEAVRLYQLALDLLQQPGSGDDGERCTVLVDLGVAQRDACDLESSKRTLLQGATLAQRLGVREQLARAALCFGTKVVWGERFAPDHDLLQLLETAISAWGDDDSPWQARLLARLSLTLHFSGEAERRGDLSRRALEMARRLDDPAVIAETLHAWLVVDWRPDKLDERLDLAAELAYRAEQIHDLESALLGHSWRWKLFFERGNGPAARAAYSRCEQLAETLRDPLYQWWMQLMRAALAVQEGRFAEAEHLAQASLGLEQRLNSGPPIGSFALLFGLWCTQGRRDALEGLARLPVYGDTYLQAIRQCSRGYIARELEDAAEARVAFAPLAARHFRDVPLNETWFLCLHRLAEICAFLEESAHAEELIDLLSPYETYVVMSHGGGGYVAPVAYDLALLSTTLSRWEVAARYFEQALEMNRSMRARPALARTQYEYARMLLARGAAGDATHARALLDEALASARELGMPLLIERLQALTNAQPSSPTSEPPAEPLQRQSRVHGNLFRCDTDYWTLAYSGAVVRLKDSKGLQYLAYLLRHPGQDLLVLDLAQGSTSPESEAQGHAAAAAVAAPILDAAAKAAYRCRLEELRGELLEAERHHDLGHTHRLRHEMGMLAAELRAAVGLGGRDRRAAGDLDRARSAVGKRIRSEIKRIRSAHPSLGRHLRATITTGYFCGYHPEHDVAVTWQL